MAQIGDLGSAGALSVTTTITAGTINFTATGYTLQTSGGTQTVNGDIVLGSGVTLGLNSTGTGNQTLNIGGSISGGTAISIQGATASSNASRINLSAANTTVASAVVINLTNTGVGGLVATATGVQITGTITNNSSGTTLIGATQGNDLTLASTAVISGSQGVRFASSTNGGAGIVTLNSQSTYSGATKFNAALSGVIKLGVSNALPTGTDVTFGGNVNTGGNLDLNGFSQEFGSLSNADQAKGQIRNNASGTTSTLTISGSAIPGSFDLEIADNTAGTGKVALVRSGTGTLTLGAQNTYTGGTTVSGGTLVLGHATNTLANSGDVTLSGGTLSLGSNSDIVNAVILASGSITGTGTLTGSSYDVRSGMISANLGGTAALTKSTSGTVTLAGDNNQYSGGTSINAGTLLVTGGNSATGTGAVGVNNGGTLGGNNTSGAIGPVTVASGGTIAPGLGGTSTGILQVGNNVTFQSGSAFVVQINGSNAGTEHDQLYLTTGSVSLDGTLTASFGTFTPNGTEQISIIRNTGSGTLTGAFTNYADGDTVATYGGYAWKIYYGTSANPFGGMDGNDVVLVPTAVPEPGSVLLACAAAAGIGMVIRGRRRMWTGDHAQDYE